MKEENKINKILSSVGKDLKVEVFNLADAKYEGVDVFHSGSYLLDDALRIGGYPYGRVIEVYGPEMSGKTTLAIMAIAELHKLGKPVLYIDAENALDMDYARQLGVKDELLYITQTQVAEDALEFIRETLSKLNSDGIELPLIVLDSVPALSPRAEIEGTMDDNTIGLQARTFSQFFRMAIALLNKSKTSLILINQIRTKIGVGPYQNPETTPGGKAIKFYASIRVEVRRGEKIVENGEQVGHYMKIKVQKNKLAPPFGSCVIPLIYGKGTLPHEELVILGIKHGIIEKAGAWIKYDGESFHGKNELIRYLEENNKFDEIKEKIFGPTESE